jgi:hypothetical protein
MAEMRVEDAEDPIQGNDDNQIDANANDNEEQEGNQQHRAIESWDHYLQRHGIEHGDSSDNYGFQSKRNLEERRRKLQEESDYQEHVHKAIFGSSQEEENSQERAQFLARLKDESIDIETSREIIKDVPLKSMAESCETLFTLASFQQTYQDDASKQQQQQRLSFSLKSFPHDAVVDFIAIMLGDKLPEEVSSDHVVPCCQIARYMQCERVVEAMVNILLGAIDNANCMSLCQLADQLDLPRLFEKSMAQMMQSVGNLQQHELWDDFNPELKRRIVDMDSVMRASIHSRLNKVYFASMEEYLSIFAENVQYYRERLAEAKERQAEEPPSGHAWADAQAKILKQEARMRTLESVLKDQKEVFGSGRQQWHHSHSHCDRRP